jgi:signal transduction histidine kinase
VRWSWTRTAARAAWPGIAAWLDFAAWLGIAGMGALLFLGGRGGEAPQLAWQWFAALALAPLAAAGFRLRRSRGSAWAWGALLVTAGLGIAGSKLAGPVPDGAARAAKADAAAAAAAARLDEACAMLTPWGLREAAALRDPEAAAAPGGSVFRAIAPLPGRWGRTERSAGLPLSVAVWRDGQRVAWTEGAAPLPAPDLVPQEGASALTWFRDRWIVRRLQSGIAGQILELQLHLPAADALWRDAIIDVISLDNRSAPLPGTVEIDADGPLTPLVVQVGAPRDTALTAWQAGRAQLYAAMLTTWALLLVGSVRLEKSGPAWLAALWVGRAFLAAADLRRWVVAALPSAEYPTAPGSWLSLVDPAYFATPVLRGWFASTADALLTSILLALTVAVIGSRIRAKRDAAPRVGDVGSHGRIWLSVLAYAVLAVAVLVLTRALAFLVATNANPRLIGSGAALSFLSFWGLHLVLLLMGLSGFGLLVVAAGWRPPARRRFVVLAGLTASLVVGLAVAALTGAGLIAGALAAVLTAAIWSSQIPGAVGTPVWRRVAWPLLVLAAAGWNYTSLTQVHDAAERAWLERHAGAITEADAGWMRFLVQSVLQEMQEADEVAAPAPPSALWRDEAAWRLYRDSALYDLGYPCLVEVMDERERTVSFFASGFLRDFRYETLSRSLWGTAESAITPTGSDVVFQDERRRYSGGQEDLLVAEAPRRSGRGWLRVEAPLRSWRISTLQDGFGGNDGAVDQYRPRAEVDRPVLILLADERGWLGSGAEGFPGPEADAAMADLRAGRRAWVEIPLGEARWLCRWSPLPATVARSRGEGFVLGIRRQAPGDTLLDFSRLVLVDLAAFFALWALFRLGRRWPWGGRGDWQPGFQEKFLAGYLALGLLLLLVVGLSVDRVGYQRVRSEARQQARDGLTMAVQQLGTLLSDQARALAESDQMSAMLRDPSDRTDFAETGDGRQAVLFGDDGTVMFDGSLAPLSAAESQIVLAAARSAPLVLFEDDDGVWAGVGVPVDLGGVDIARPMDGAAGPGHGGTVSNGLFFYRQRLDAALLTGLADVLQGELTLSLDGVPQFASHPEGLFAGRRPQLLDPGLMATLFDHPQGPGLASPPGRPFACDAAQPLPALARERGGNLARRAVPAVLGVSFPGREREFAAQRRSTVLFLAGLANLILLTALLLAVLMSWNLFRPLRVLSRATRSLAEGDYAAPLPPTGRDEVGRLAAAFGAMRAQIQLARDDLAERERFLATVLERVTVGVAVLTPSGELVVLNPAGRAILARFWPGSAPPEAAARLLAGLVSREPRAAAAGELMSDDGRLTLRGAVAPLDDSAVAGDQMVVFEDVSEFLATKKLALNAELARQVAHEIKNPLTPIRLSVQLLGQAWQDRHPQLERIVPETVARVLDQVDLLRRIASEFSLLGRPDELPRRPLYLEAVVAKVSAAYTGAGDGEAVVRGAPAEGLPPVLAHEESVLKILGNLMQNSLDAARPGVAPVIETEWRVADGRVRLHWRDNGAGLPADVADRLFEPYFSTKSKGTGLGLAICRSLAERMGGHISLCNRDDGMGAEAVLDLPVAPDVGETA